MADLGMRIEGADLASLRRLVSQLAGPCQHDFGDALRTMNRQVQASSVYWTGEYADRFRDGFANFTVGVTRDLGQVLAQAARLTGQHLDAISVATGAGTANPGHEVAASADPLQATDRGVAWLSPAKVPDPPVQPAVDQAKVDGAISYFDKHIGDSGGWLWPDLALGAQEVLQDWQMLSPAELNAVLEALSPHQLSELNSALGQGGSDSDLRTAMANLLLGAAAPDALTKVEHNVPNLEPDSKTDYESNLHYAAASGDLFPGSGVAAESDVVQGDDGDCWFLAALGTLVLQDPGFPAQHIKQNLNGTYTVTFYRDGKPVEITVDGLLPTRSDGSVAYAQPADNSQWVAIYEKAYAQFKGGYGSIDGGYGDTGLQDLTGTSAWRGSPDDYSLGKVADLMQHGQVLTAGTKDDKSLWNKIFGGGPKTEDNFQLVTSHEYMVKSVDMNAHPPTITVVNPWGGGGVEDGHQMPQEVTLTEKQWTEYFNEVSGTRP
jgi:hypothetical protein